MSTAARKRLMRDFKRLQNDPPAGVSGAPLDNNVMIWQAVIFGPDETSWEGGTFRLLLEFSEDYPNKPPTVRFLSKIFHPNVYADGKICLDILQNQWSPIYDIAAILTSSAWSSCCIDLLVPATLSHLLFPPPSLSTSVQSLLSDPNPASPANAEASQLYERDRREYNKRVRAVVEASWIDDDNDGAEYNESSSSSSGSNAATGGEEAGGAALPAAGGGGAGAGDALSGGVSSGATLGSPGGTVFGRIEATAATAAVAEG